MQMFAAAEWRDGMKNSGGRRDLKSLFWTLFIIPWDLLHVADRLIDSRRFIDESSRKYYSAHYKTGHCKKKKAITFWAMLL